MTRRSKASRPNPLQDLRIGPGFPARENSPAATTPRNAQGGPAHRPHLDAARVEPHDRSSSAGGFSVAAAPVVPPGPRRRPVYARLLRLRHLHLRGWQAALLGEGSLVVAGLFALADLVPAWTVVVFPPLVAALVKLHDVLAGALRRAPLPTVGTAAARRGPETGTAWSWPAPPGPGPEARRSREPAGAYRLEEPVSARRRR